jgi:Na+/H+ antiporter NhaA
MAGEEQAAARPRPAEPPLSGRTAWVRSLETPLRQFLRTETGSAAVLLAATLAALLWVNVSASSYQAVWGTRLAITVGGHGVSDDLQGWVILA